MMRVRRMLTARGGWYRLHAAVCCAVAGENGAVAPATEAGAQQMEKKMVMMEQNAVDDCGWGMVHRRRKRKDELAYLHQCAWFLPLQIIVQCLKVMSLYSCWQAYFEF